MNFKKFIQSEMAITNFTKIGDWSPEAKRNYGFDKKDAALLNSERAVEKIHRLFSKSKINFDFYFVRTKEAYKHVEIGEVSPEWVKKNIGLDIQPRKDAVTVIYTNNTGAEKFIATAWTIAHRLGHAIRRDKIFDEYFYKEIVRDFKEILKNVYGIDKQRTSYGGFYGYGYNIQQDDEKELRAFAYAIGTMKSARQSNLRNFYEFVYELVAQWIITGNIKFNPIPNSLILRKRMAWGRPANDIRNSRLDNMELEEWNEILQGHAQKYEHYLDTVFSGIEGKMFVM